VCVTCYCGFSLFFPRLWFSLIFKCAILLSRKRVISNGVALRLQRMCAVYVIMARDAQVRYYTAVPLNRRGNMLIIGLNTRCLPE
jgi:hypothetical protein